MSNSLFQEGEIMFTWQNGQLVVSIEWVDVQYIALVINVVYGYITHLHSLKEINEWNQEDEGHHLTIGQQKLALLLIYRLFLNFPIRLVAVIMGILFIMTSVVSATRVMSNPVFVWGWQWHEPPCNIAAFR